MKSEMLTWLSIAILSRFLLAANSEMNYQGENRDVDQQQQQQRQEVMRSDSRTGETPMGISNQATIKPIENTEKLRDKDGEIFQGGTGRSDADLYNGNVIYTGLNIDGLSGVIRPLESFESRSENDGDNQDKEKRSTKERKFNDNSEPNAPLRSSWISFKNLGGKTPRPFQEPRANPWQEIKKSRAFSPWGGKRVAVMGQPSKVRRPIRVPFNSWGGKRGHEETAGRRFGATADVDDVEKRTKFSSWGGKRGSDFGRTLSGIYDYEDEVEKRTKFNAWGGKRSKNGERDEEETKRTRFNAWGGKRNDEISEKRSPEEVFAKKSVFNAWGGKRFATEEGKTSETEDGVYPGPKDANADENNGVDFGSWGGSIIDGEIIGLPDRRGVGSGKHLRRSAFNPWGGRKRSLQLTGGTRMGKFYSPEGGESGEFEGLERKVPFWSWGG